MISNNPVKLSYEELEAEVKRLLHRETFFDAIQEIAHFGYCEWDYDNDRIISCSPAYAQIFGMSIEEVVESQSSWLKIMEQIHPDDRNHYSDAYRSQMTAGSYEVEYRIFRKDGELRHIKEVGMLVRDDDGKGSEAVGLVQDVTVHANMRKNIEESAAKLKLAARTAKLGYWHFDEVTLEYLDISEEFAEIYGYTVPEFLDRITTLEDDMKTVHPEDREAIYEAYELSDGKLDCDYRMQHKDGHWIHVREISTDIKDRAGNFIESIGTLQDITEQKKAEQSLRESRDSLESVVEERTRQLANTINQLEQEIIERKNISSELENQNAELERFAYTVSHDLKTPLVTIKGFLGFLDKDILTKDMTRVKSDIESINSATDTMSALLDDLLELSRIGRVMGNPVICDLAEVTKQAIKLIGAKVDKLGIEIVIEDMPKINGDEKRLVEVYLNLIENAIKFMGEQKSPRINIGAVEKDGMICCFMQDNGIGIAAEYHELIFGLFERLSVDVGGTGVGLSLVKRIIEVHGGEIWVESEGLDLGSKFSFTLPKP
jgi:PAS domain S-box-containing protein